MRGGARAVAVETRETDGGADQDRRSQEQVIGGVVQQVEAGGRVHVGVSHQLAGEQRLPGAAAQQAAHLAVGHVHPVGQHLRRRTDNPTSSAPPTPQRSPRGGLTFILSWTRLTSALLMALLPRCLQVTEAVGSQSQSQQMVGHWRRTTGTHLCCSARKTSRRLSSSNRSAKPTQR